jgi:carboxypeptidase family protein/TonB-dependent receptor-like protein
MWVRFCAMRAALCLFLIVPGAALAQETVHLASVSGRVTDPSGATLQGARVAARQTETNLTATALTDADGRFRFPYLKAGSYEITISDAGFADTVRTLTLTVGAAFDVPVTLALATLESGVTVAAPVVVLEAARSQIAATVSQSEVRSLPLNGRNFLDLALLVPGVSPPNVGGAQLFAETSAVAGPGVSVGSQRNFSNNFIVDGLSANDDAAGLSGIPYGVDAVDQFQVVTSGGQAELGRALGGYVNVLTKSGTNVWHGGGYGYARDHRLNAVNPLSHATLPMQQAQYGGSLGGPLVRDRTFVFTNVEQRRLDQTGLVTIAPASAAAINARLAAVGYTGTPVATGEYPNPVHTTNVLGKVDHQFSGRDQFGIRYSLYGAQSRNSRGAGALNAASASAGLDNVDQTVAFSNTVTLSARTVNETRAQIATGDLKAPPTDGIGAAVSIAGVASFGTLSGSPTARTNRMYQIVNNLSHQAGAHALRAGVDVLYNDDTITFPRSFRGAYTFSSLANFLSGTYNNAGFTQTFGASVVSQTNPNAGVYAQDEWKAAPSLTVNAGLRYDLQFLQTIQTDRNNLSPRIGFAWSPSASHRTLVRGSAGLFYDRVPLRALANALLSAGNTTDLANLRQTSLSLSPTQAGAPAFPGILDAPVPSVTLLNLTTMDRRMQNAYSRQGSVEIERQIGDGATVSVGYQYSRGDHLIAQVNQNVPACLPAGTNNGCRPDPSYANNNQYSPIGHSAYHALNVAFVQRPTRLGSYRVSYSLSKAMNDVGENFFSSPIDPADISKDWGRSDDDQRHRLVVSGSLNLPLAFQLSGLLQSYSHLPLNITSGVTTLQGTAGRPIVNGAFIGRNTGQGPDFFNAGLRLSRVFAMGRGVRAEGMIEAFNLTNRFNPIAVNANFGAGAYPSTPSPAFGQVTAVGEPRSIQLALRLTF